MEYIEALERLNLNKTLKVHKILYNEEFVCNVVIDCATDKPLFSTEKKRVNIPTSLVLLSFWDILGFDICPFVYEAYTNFAKNRIFLINLTYKVEDGMCFHVILKAVKGMWLYLDFAISFENPTASTYLFRPEEFPKGSAIAFDGDVVAYLKGALTVWDYYRPFLKNHKDKFRDKGGELRNQQAQTKAFLNMVESLKLRGNF